MDVHGKDNASIADPYQTVAVDVMDARETQELTLTARPPRPKRERKRPQLPLDVSQGNCCLAGIWRGTACFLFGGLLIKVGTDVLAWLLASRIKPNGGTHFRARVWVLGLGHDPGPLGGKGRGRGFWFLTCNSPIQTANLASETLGCNRTERISKERNMDLVPTG